MLAAASPRAEHYIDVSDSIDVGMASLRAHAAYLEAMGGGVETEGWLRSSAEQVGTEVGVAHAIAVEMI